MLFQKDISTVDIFSKQSMWPIRSKWKCESSQKLSWKGSPEIKFYVSQIWRKF